MSVCTAIHVCLYGHRQMVGHTDIAAELLKARAAVSPTVWDGATPLHFAAANGFFDLAKLLIDARADVEASCWGGRATTLDNQQVPPLKCIHACTHACAHACTQRCVNIWPFGPKLFLFEAEWLLLQPSAKFDKRDLQQEEQWGANPPHYPPLHPSSSSTATTQYSLPMAHMSSQ